MIQNRTIGRSVAISNPVVSIPVVSIIRPEACIKISNRSEKQLSTNLKKDIGSKSRPSKISSDYLSAEKIQKMLVRLLTETPIPKRKLAEALGITVKSLIKLCSLRALPAVIHKINLPLIKLYCATKFQQPIGENKDAISKLKKYV